MTPDALLYLVLVYPALGKLGTQKANVLGRITTDPNAEDWANAEVVFAHDREGAAIKAYRRYFDLDGDNAREPVGRRCYVIGASDKLPTADDVTIHTLTAEQRFVVVPVP